MRPVVTRLTTWKGVCPQCGEVHSTHPLQVSQAQGAAGVHLGPRAVAWATLLNKQFGIPLRKTCSILQRGFGLKLSAGGLAQMLNQQSKCISVACHSLWTGTALADQMISKEGLHQRRDQPRAAVHESPPGSQEHRKASPAAVNNSGVAVKYQ